METKFSEEIIITSDVRKMRGKYLAENLYRKWNEDFVDEDTGDCVTIERKEIIYQKGIEINDDEMTVLNFHQQTGDISEVKVSNQQRMGTVGFRQSAVWQVTANYGTKKYNLFMYSNSIEKTKEIVNDYLEQMVMGIYTIAGIKELDYSTLIPEDFGVENDGIEELQTIDREKNYYKIEVAIVDEDYERRETFIVSATDAEQGKEIIVKYLLFLKARQAQEAEEYRIDETLITIISAKTIPCDYVISYEFSLEYLQNENEA